MRTYRYTPSGDAYGLTLSDEASLSVLPAGMVRVRVRACSLNYRDLITLKKQGGRDVTGRIPLSDGAGEVLETGEGVTRCKPGDRVAGCFFQNWISGRFEMNSHKHDLGGQLDGMLAEEVVLPEAGIVKTPEHLSDEEASCLPCAGLTAWYALTVRGGLRPGDKVLVLGTGGVSIFALQFATALGAVVVATSSSDAKLVRARDLGAAHTINYKTTPDWDEEVWKVTEKRGVDHVVEVGGPGTLEKSMNSLAAGGRIAMIGVLTGFGAPQASLFPLVARNASLEGIYVGPRDAFETMNHFLSERRIFPVVDKVFPFSQAAEAFSYMESGSHFGKIVIRCDG